MSKYICGATVDIGVERESQEDFVQYREFGDNLFCVVADGAGSQKGFSQPAVIVVSDILETLTEIYEENEELFLHNPEFFIKRAMLSANRVLGGFKMGNEERYYGYAASVTCCLFCQDGTFYMGHTGNTRLYILRNSMLTQMTRDQTKAAELLNDGKIDLETYHVHPDRLVITDGLGILLKPHIQTLHGKLKENDIVLMSSDGLHYAIQPDTMAAIILESKDCMEASKNLIDASKNIIKYPDNMSAMVIYREKRS